MSRSILSICPLIVAIGLAGPVAAGPANPSLGTSEDAQIHVQIAPDDLSNPTKARFVLARLQAAARAVCTGDVGDPQSLMAEEQCYRAALNDAVGSTHSAILVALNEGSVTRGQFAALTADPKVSGAGQTLIASSGAH